MPIEKPNGPWSEINKPPYPLPKVGPEELPDDYFDQFDNSEVLPEEVREFWREKWRVWRKAIVSVCYLLLLVGEEGYRRLEQRRKISDADTRSTATTTGRSEA